MSITPLAAALAATSSDSNMPSGSSVHHQRGERNLKRGVANNKYPTYTYTVPSSALRSLLLPSVSRLKCLVLCDLTVGDGDFLKGCARLRRLHLREVKGVDDRDVAELFGKDTNESMQAIR